MKKWFLTLCLTTAAVTIQADDYGFLTIEAADGTTASVAVDQLKLTFSDGQLVAVNNSGTQAFSLSQLKKMYFSANAVNGISQSVADEAQQVEVFTVGGVSLGTFDNISAAKAALKTGLYIIKSGNRTVKIAVK